jgi:alkyl hydroperoxide reductase subunit D
MSASSYEPLIETLFGERATAVARDLKLNLKKLLDDGALSPAEAGVTLLAVATALGHRPLAEVAEARLTELGTPPEHIQEARESAAIMGMLNRYYRFRHYIESTQGKEAVQASFRAAGLRMNSLSKPALGTALFELAALAVSVVNGCEVCVTAHEQTLRKHGVDGEKIHDAARLAAAASGAATLLA